VGHRLVVPSDESSIIHHESACSFFSHRLSDGFHSRIILLEKENSYFNIEAEWNGEKRDNMSCHLSCVAKEVLKSSYKFRGQINKPV
jgi:hypothetical protein